MGPSSGGSEEERPSPERELAQALATGLREDFPEREPTALHLAELLLDAIDDALPLAEGKPAGPALAKLELLATRADVYSWDGPPGWDEVLARGIVRPVQLAPGPSPLDGLGAPALREQQRALLEERAREVSLRLLGIGRAAARLPLEGSPYARPVASAAAIPPHAAASPLSVGPGGALVALHAELLRLLALAAASSLLALPEDPRSGALAAPGKEAIVAEMDARARAGSDFASGQEEWLARLLTENPAAAAAPAFRTFFAGLGQTLRTAPALRRFRDEAREGRLAREPEAILGAVGGWQPIRWSALRAGAPALWLRELCPPVPEKEAPLARLSRECSLALDLAGRLWIARDLSITGFASLAALFVARCASALALWEELGGA